MFELMLDQDSIPSSLSRLQKDLKTYNQRPALGKGSGQELDQGSRYNHSVHPS